MLRIIVPLGHTLIPANIHLYGGRRKPGDEFTDTFNDVFSRYETDIAITYVGVAGDFNYDISEFGRSGVHSWKRLDITFVSAWYMTVEEQPVARHAHWQDQGRNRHRSDHFLISDNMKHGEEELQIGTQSGTGRTWCTTRSRKNKVTRGTDLCF